VICFTADIKQCKAFGGNIYSPLRQVTHLNNTFKWEQNDDTAMISGQQIPIYSRLPNTVPCCRATVEEVDNEGDTVETERTVIEAETEEVVEKRETMALVLWRP